MSLPTSSSHCDLTPKGPFIDSNLDQSMLDSSLEANTSHAGFEDSASALMVSQAGTSSKIKSSSGYGSARTSTSLLHAASAVPRSQGVPRSSSISRAYSATLSRLSGNSSRLSAASIKFGEKSAVTMSKALSSRNLRLRKRPGLPDFKPLHCERKVFEDGIVVQMIGSAIPPRLAPIIQTEGGSFPPIERRIPHIDVEFNLDESSFGLNNAQSTETLQIQVRSPSLELECPDIIVAFDGSLQTIYHSMEDLTLAGDRPAVVAGPSTTTLLSPYESTSQVDVFRSTSPRLSVSLMPKLSPIILSELSSLGEAEPSISTQATLLGIQTPVTPALSPALTPASEEPSPISTLNVLEDMDEASLTVARIYINHGSEHDVLTALNLDLGDTPTDTMSASESDLYGKGRRWDSLDPSSVFAPVENIESSGHAAQRSSSSSSSVLAPLTEADFEASFEEVFRTGFMGRHTVQNDDQTTPKPKRLSVTTKFNKSTTMDCNLDMATFPRRGHGTSTSRVSLTASLA